MSQLSAMEMVFRKKLSLLQLQRRVVKQITVVLLPIKKKKKEICLSIRSQCGWKEITQNENNEIVFDLKVEVTGRSQRAPLFPLVFRLFEKHSSRSLVLVAKAVVNVKAITKIPKKPLNAELIPEGINTSLTTTTPYGRASPPLLADIMNSPEQDEDTSFEEHPLNGLEILSEAIQCESQDKDEIDLSQSGDSIGENVKEDNSSNIKIAAPKPNKSDAPMINCPQLPLYNLQFPSSWSLSSFGGLLPKADLASCSDYKRKDLPLTPTFDNLRLCKKTRLLGMKTIE